MMLTDNTPRLDRIKAALALAPTKADRQIPKALTDAAAIEAKIRAYGLDAPTIRDLTVELVNADPDEFDTLLGELATEWQARQFMHAAVTEGGRTHYLAERRNAAIHQAVPITLERLAPVFATAATTLAKAAPKLPQGPAALDPVAILEADAGSPYRQARDAISTLRTIAAVHNVYRRDSSTPAGTDVAALAALPETEPITMHPDLQLKVNTPEMLEAITAVKDVVTAYGENPDLALVDIARGHYPRITLDLAPDDETLKVRVGYVSTAHKVKRLREYAAPATT